MTLDPFHWDGPPLSTVSVEAMGHYRHGIAALVSGIANAEQSLHAAIDIDDGFFLAHVGHAGDLRREHLLEFPGDLLIVWLPALHADVGA